MRVYPAGPVVAGGGTLWIVDGAPRGAALEWTLTGPGTLTPVGSHADAGGVGSASYLPGAGAAGQPVQVSVRAWPMAKGAAVEDGGTGGNDLPPITISRIFAVQWAPAAAYDPATGLLTLPAANWFVRYDDQYDTPLVRVWDAAGAPHEGRNDPGIPPSPPVLSTIRPVQLPAGLALAVVGGQIRIDFLVAKASGWSRPYPEPLEAAAAYTLSVEGTGLDQVTAWEMWDPWSAAEPFKISDMAKVGGMVQSSTLLHLAAPALEDQGCGELRGPFAGGVFQSLGPDGDGWVFVYAST